MDLTASVGATLKKLYPDITQLRRNKLEQGHEPHSFYIRRGRVRSQNQLGRTQMRVYPFILHYYPKAFKDGATDKSETACEEMAERLLTSFHYLNDYEGKIINHSYEVHDGVLLFYFNIRMRTILPKSEGTPMQSMEERGNLIDI